MNNRQRGYELLHQAIPEIERNDRSSSSSPSGTTRVSVAVSPVSSVDVEGPVVDMTRPNCARMYDYCLDGKDHFDVDRVAVAEIERVFPTVKTAARANREFMNRTTRYLAERGVHQFIDIGTGMSNEPNLHQVARQVAPDARVVYVDNDLTVMAYARVLMAEATACVHADVCEPEAILTAPELIATLNLRRPVALNLCAVMHFVTDDRAHSSVTTLVDALAPGSFLVMSHVTADYNPDIDAAIQTYGDSVAPVVTRNREEFARFFAGLDMVEPGITGPHRWHISTALPVDADAAVSLHAAVGYKPGPGNRR